MKKATYFSGVSIHSPNAVFTQSARSFAAPGQLDTLLLLPFVLLLVFVRFVHSEYSSSSISFHDFEVVASHVINA